MAQKALQKAPEHTLTEEWPKRPLKGRRAQKGPRLEKALGMAATPPVVVGTLKGWHSVSRFISIWVDTFPHDAMQLVRGRPATISVLAEVAQSVLAKELDGLQWTVSPREAKHVANVVVLLFTDILATYEPTTVVVEDAEAEESWWRREPSEMSKAPPRHAVVLVSNAKRCARPECGCGTFTLAAAHRLDPARNRNRNCCCCC